MKGKKMIVGCLAAVLLMGMFAHAETKATITAYFDRIKLVVNELPVGKETLLYNGTTYVPIKAAAELLDMAVTYDDTTKTAYLNNPDEKTENSGDNESDKNTGVDAEVAPVPEGAETQGTETKATITVYFDRIKLVINGQPADKETLLYNGTTYVPIKAAAEMLGMDVAYEDETKTAYLNSTEEQNENPDENGTEEPGTGTEETTSGAVTDKKDELPPPGLGDVTYGPVIGTGKNNSDAGNYVTMIVFGREMTFNTKSLSGVDKTGFYRARFDAKSNATLTDYVPTAAREGVLGTSDPAMITGIPDGAIKGTWSGNVLTLSYDQSLTTTVGMEKWGVLKDMTDVDKTATVTVDKDKKIYVFEKGEYTVGSSSDVRSCRGICLYDVRDKDQIIDIILVIK